MEERQPTPHSNNQGNLGISGAPSTALTQSSHPQTSLASFITQVRLQPLYERHRQAR